jgi:hypothetical protein
MVMSQGKAFFPCWKADDDIHIALEDATGNGVDLSLAESVRVHDARFSFLILPAHSLVEPES